MNSYIIYLNYILIYDTLYGYILIEALSASAGELGGGNLSFSWLSNLIQTFTEPHYDSPSFAGTLWVDFDP